MGPMIGVLILLRKPWETFGKKYFLIIHLNGLHSEEVSGQGIELESTRHPYLRTVLDWTQPW